LNILGFRAGTIDGIFGNNTEKAVKAFQSAAKQWYPDIGSPDGFVGPKTRAAFANHPTYQFKTGGLADFTGPAWLDGTKSKPEYILNADQTKAFFTLVDVLSGLQANTSKSSEKTGDNTYDIDINVESIGSDYDVEQLATTVKRLINEDARYRNNNTINLTR
jgi:peptidoglycan hydrolase-like protein with peptidoglycan-binding domain